MVLPSDYKQQYMCINENSATSKIYVNQNLTKAYKIYNLIINLNVRDDKYVETFLSIIQDELQTDSLADIRRKILK